MEPEHLFTYVITLACEDPWTRFGDNCFLGLAPMSVVTAEDTCADHGGHLWYPETPEELNYVTAIYG